MEFRGVLPEDAPDPREKWRARAMSAPFSRVGLVAQPTLEDHGNVGWSQESGPTGITRESVAVTYTLIRHPERREDPANLADLDAASRAAIDTVPPWPRPSWLIEAVERMRYPHLWEAVRTSWSREPGEQDTVAEHLIHHANYVLRNQFREELGLPDGPVEDRAWAIRPAAVNATEVWIDLDGRRVPASEIDTDPFVYAIGAAVDACTVVTVVIAREHLPFVRLALVTQSRQDAE